ncbi:hypothetical protein Fmac_014479 [Flemingia macrophylla]|uniref:Uncharacterized protein n=1 Tax=Flemingia macrophylla TaxID=520843 RepID=A0ABD1MBV2_9FABA
MVVPVEEAIAALSTFSLEVVVEALQVGALQKLLLVLQVGCAHEIKENATPSQMERESTILSKK